MEGAAIVVTPVTEVAKCAAVPVVTYFSYLFRRERNVNDLQTKVQNLFRLEDDIKGKVNLARDNVIHKVVEQWLVNVERVRSEIAELLCEAGKNNISIKGQRSACHRLGEESEMKLDELLAEGRSFSSVSDPAPAPAPAFNAFVSREATKKEVIQALMDDKTILIGIYGMGGVGKTTLMKEICKQVEETKLFDKVMLATVSQNLNLRRIQAQIAESLGMRIEEESIEARAAKLSARLKHEKKILLILDDLWTRLELTDIGIILGRVSENTCKVIITSRSLDVCNSMKTTENMKSTKNIEVKAYEDRVHNKMTSLQTHYFGDQCLSLPTPIPVPPTFYGMSWEEVEEVEDDYQQMWRFHYVVLLAAHRRACLRILVEDAVAGEDEKAGVPSAKSEEIANECDGLPLAIVILARTLRNKDRRFWDAVIQQLKKSMCCGMSPVNALIKLSYDFLEISKTKLCFLLCAVFPEDHKVTMDALVGYAMGENFLGEVETLSEARGNLHIIVDTLACSGLLLKGEDDEFFMMHDIVRDAAISIARENRNDSIMSAGLGLQKWPEMKEAGKCLRMSLMSNYFNEVPDTLECSKLVTLSLARNKSLMEIPHGFFGGIKCLATLDLSGIGINYLPQSLSSLNNCLLSLYLDNCTKLQDISVIENLKTFEILSLQRIIGILKLPEELRRLTNLKMLNLTDNWNILTCIPPKVISSLFSLEELYMIDSFDSWEIEGSGDNASLAEVASLTNLTSLGLDIPNTQWLSTDIGPCQSIHSSQEGGLDEY
ncbi:hypothetical protein GIB67_004102 [Kingdonia uniflora]|uniref:AAA+ ATPase domain-containing protein n=1 Tax=Kingdonia uniflora TaxID=39325 RepID=A0A7J7NRN4_9MAGN|nr:hypothetical protein GIB67_004102 [Kingdonia uniflora]